MTRILILSLIQSIFVRFSFLFCWKLFKIVKFWKATRTCTGSRSRSARPVIRTWLLHCCNAVNRSPQIKSQGNARTSHCKLFYNAKHCKFFNSLISFFEKHFFFLLIWQFKYSFLYKKKTKFYHFTTTSDTLMKIFIHFLVDALM